MAKNREDTFSNEVAPAIPVPDTAKPTVDLSTKEHAASQLNKGLSVTEAPKEKTYVDYVKGLTSAEEDKSLRDSMRQLQLAAAVGIVASQIEKALGGGGYHSPDVGPDVARALKAALAIDSDYGKEGYDPELYGSFNLDGAMTAVLQLQGSLASHGVKDYNKGDYVSGLVAQLVRALLAVYSEAEIKFNGRKESNAETAKADFQKLMGLSK